MPSVCVNKCFCTLQYFAVHSACEKKSPVEMEMEEGGFEKNRIGFLSSVEHLRRVPSRRG